MTKIESLTIYLKNLDTDYFSFSPFSDTVCLDGNYNTNQLKLIIELIEEYKNE